MDRAVDQPVQLVSCYHCQSVQRTLANRAFLQGFEAATEGEEFCWHLSKRSAVPNVGCSDRLSASQLSEIQIKVSMVIINAELYSSDESIHEEKSLGLAECIVSCREPFTSKHATV